MKNGREARRSAGRKPLSLSVFHQGDVAPSRGTERRTEEMMMSLTTSTFAPKFSVKTPATTTRRAATTTTRARLDSGVGAFGSKAGMTQIFTDDGLCVPVTVIAVREGNIVTQVCI
jgi:hypothetical protein